MMNRFFLMPLILFMTFYGQVVKAGVMYGTPSVWVKDTESGYTNTYCGMQWAQNQIPLLDVSKFVSGGCTFDIPDGNYVPKTGLYAVRVTLTSMDNHVGDWAVTNYLTIDATKPIGSQNLHFSGGGHDIYPGLITKGTVYMCVYLQTSESPLNWYLINGYSSTCAIAGGGGYLPPTPVPPPTSCKINNGNSLSVDLGTMERVGIPTSPGSGQSKKIEFPVTCTGGDVNMNMQINYTPITVSGTQVINSSINGLGVAIGYDNKFMKPADIVPLSFVEGANNVSLDFEAVRDPAVAVADIKTGPFTASAVLVMTQQ
ncbi:fimbrial protein [Franconibacter daqui]|uniref:fimbrial protein n=1 Tax=Franconibacter daqui TaxID=2047724 RepID=UPI0030D3C035